MKDYRKAYQKYRHKYQDRQWGGCGVGIIPTELPHLYKNAHGVYAVPIPLGVNTGMVGVKSDTMETFLDTKPSDFESTTHGATNFSWSDLEKAIPGFKNKLDSLDVCPQKWHVINYTPTQQEKIAGMDALKDIQKIYEEDVGQSSQMGPDTSQHYEDRAHVGADVVRKFAKGVALGNAWESDSAVETVFWAVLADKM